MSTVADRPPAIVLPKPDGIPAELRELPQWVCWRWEQRNGKWTKPPVNPKTGGFANNTDPSTWAPFEIAADYALRNDAGIGFVFCESDPYCGIDFDDCRNPETGIVDDEVYQQIMALDSYAEISPSNTGIKVFCKAKLPPGKRRKGKVEMYDSRRFFVVTSRHLFGTPESIEERQTEVETLYREVFGDGAPAPQERKAVPSPQGRASTDIADELIEKAKAADNGEKFSALWAGDWTGYPSQSEADLALCSLLAFWTNGDAARIDRLFRMSGLYRDKWVQTHGDRSYGDITVSTAMKSFTRGYAGHKNAALLCFHTTDLGNAERLVARHGEDLRYCSAWGKWFIWNRRRWAPDTTNEVQRRAAETIRAFGKQAFDEPDPELRKKLVGWALRSESRERIDAMIGLARSFADVVVKPEDLDADPWLLNVQNGTVDLRTGQLREHRQSDLLTKLAPVEYDPTATGDRWQRHIEMFLPNQNVRQQVQRDLGVGLVGTTLDENLPIWYGTGANGKTTTARALMHIMGDYADRAAPNLLIQSKYERHPTELADLCGRRLIFSVEIDPGKHLAEALIKDLTGGDRKKARFMNQDFFSFEQTFSVVLIVNHKPIVTGSDTGIWRRINLISWEYHIEDKDKRPQEDVVTELVAEGTAILSWLLAGLKDWQHDHSWKAPEVQAANAAYRAEMDVLSEFISERCVLGPRCTVPKGELFKAYMEWGESNHEKPISRKEFAQQMEARGIGEDRTGKERTRCWRGIGLLTPIEKLDEDRRTQADVISVYPGENAHVGKYMENVSAHVRRDALSPTVSGCGQTLTEGEDSQAAEDSQGAQAPFTPSSVWQEILNGVVVPPGGEFRLDFATGKNFGRWPDPPPSPVCSICGQPRSEGEGSQCEACRLAWLEGEVQR